MPKMIQQRNNNQAAWSGLVLVVVTFMLLGVYFLRIDSAELVSYDIDPNLVVYKTKVAQAAGSQDLMEYYNADYNFIINYPIDNKLTTKSSAEGELDIFTVEIVDNLNKVTVSVLPVELEGVVRTSINIEKEQDIIIDYKEAIRIDGSSVKDGSAKSLVIVEDFQYLITIEGTGQNFEDIVSYFEII